MRANDMQSASKKHLFARLLYEPNGGGFLLPQAHARSVPLRPAEQVLQYQRTDEIQPHLHNFDVAGSYDFGFRITRSILFQGGNDWPGAQAGSL